MPNSTNGGSAAIICANNTSDAWATFTTTDTTTSTDTNSSGNHKRRRCRAAHQTTTDPPMTPPSTTTGTSHDNRAGTAPTSAATSLIATYDNANDAAPTTTHAKAGNSRYNRSTDNLLQSTHAHTRPHPTPNPTGRTPHTTDSGRTYPPPPPPNPAAGTPMAHLHISGSATKGERFVAQQLATHLDNQWHLLVGLEYLNPVGETDIVTIHPTAGITILEVKSGPLTVTADGSRWHTPDGRHHTANPFHQGRKAAEKLETICRDTLTAPPTITYATLSKDEPVNIASPHPGTRSQPLPILNPKQWNDPTIAHTLAQLHPTTSPHPQLTPDELHLLLTRLIPQGPASSPQLPHTIARHHRQIKQLTDEQRRAYLTSTTHTRTAYSGRAGTGKTVLATATAHHLAEHGHHVLLYTPTSWLADHLHHQTRPSVSDSGQIDVHTADSLHTTLTGTPLKRLPSRSRRPGDDWSTDRATVDQFNPATQLAAAFDTHLFAWDALVVDETQDVPPDLLELLAAQLHPNAPTHLYGDPNQRRANHTRLDGTTNRSNEPPWLANLELVELTRNCRSAWEIENVAANLLGLDTPRSRLRGGMVSTDPIPIPTYTTDRVETRARTISEAATTTAEQDWLTTLVRTITRRIDDRLNDGVAPDQITLLCSYDLDWEHLIRRRDAGHPLGDGIDLLSRPRQQITYTHPSGRQWTIEDTPKGMETDTLILCACHSPWTRHLSGRPAATRGSRDVLWWDEPSRTRYLYTAITRARSAIHIIHPGDSPYTFIADH